MTTHVISSNIRTNKQ